MASVSDVLLSGGIIAYPTEGVWGLGCDPFNQAAVKRIFALKGREVDKGLILACADLQQARQLVNPDIAVDQWHRASETWPGPVTWLLPAGKNIPSWITGQSDLVAVRVSAHPVVKQICQDFGKAIVSTSANPSGEPPALSRETLDRYFSKRIDMVVDGELHHPGRPSEIWNGLTGKQVR